MGNLSIKMERRIEMNFSVLKSDLDNLFKRLKEPTDIVPEWTDPGISPAALKEGFKYFIFNKSNWISNCSNWFSRRIDLYLLGTNNSFF